MLSKELDQYFTTNEILIKGFKREVNRIVDNEMTKLSTLRILEPSIGAGNLISYLPESAYENITGIEIDPKVTKELTEKGINIIHTNFLTHEFENKFDLILMNPPFTYTSEFIAKCTELLTDGGYLICLCQDNTLKLTKNIQLLKSMNESGEFVSLRKYTDENLFKNASIGVIIFVYHKYRHIEPTDCGQVCRYYVDNKPSGEKMYTINPIFQFVDKQQTQLSELFNVYVGYVSGADNILKSETETETDNIISILKKENKKEFYYNFFNETEALECKQIAENKNKLLSRKIKKFDSTNWFTFGLKRNENIIKENYGRECIYVYNQTRNQKIAFISTVQHFGGNLLMLLPKNDSICLQEIADILNATEFKEQYITSGDRFKISHKQLSSSYITYTINNLPGIIKELKTYIENNKEHIIFNKQSDDGRINSALNEINILNVIKNFHNDDYNIFIPSSRWWFDFALVNKTDENKYIPINIKITTTKTADNSAGYSSLAYALTNLEMKFNKQYNNSIIKDIKFEETERDYWFLVIDLTTKNIILNSLKGLDKITGNKCNLPFQIRWSDNKFYNLKPVNKIVSMIRDATIKNKSEDSLFSKHIKLFS